MVLYNSVMMERWSHVAEKRRIAEANAAGPGPDGSAEKPLSARAAGEKLDIGYNQIADMVKGKSPGEKTLIKFASAIGESPATGSICGQA